MMPVGAGVRLPASKVLWTPASVWPASKVLVGAGSVSGVHRTGSFHRPAVLVVVSQDLDATSDGVGPVHVSAHADREARAAAAARPRQDLKPQSLEHHRVVPSDLALLFLEEDRIEIEGTDRYEPARRIGRGAREGLVVHGQVAAPDVLVRLSETTHPRQLQLLHQTILKRPVGSFAPTTPLRRVRRNVLDPKTLQHRPHSRQSRLVHRPPSLLRLESPTRTIAVHSPRDSIGPDHFVKAAQHPTRRLLLPQLCVQHPRRRVVDDAQHRLPLPSHQLEPFVVAPVDQNHVSKARTWLTTHTMSPTRLLPLHQPRFLQQLLHRRVRQLHSVLPPHRLMKVPHIPPTVPLPVQPQNPLHLPYRRTSDRRHPPSSVQKPRVTVLLEPHPPPPQSSRAHPQNLRRSKPVNLPRQRLQNHFLNLHRPLPGGLRVGHPPSHTRLPPPRSPPKKRPLHLL